MALPKMILKNQFGEQSNNYILGASDQIDIDFIVDSTNGNGLGIRSLKSSALFAKYGAASVYMNTSATPAAGNPNPAAGLILVQLSQGYAGYIGGYSGFVTPVSGTPINVTSALTVGNPYIITSVGSTSTAGWQSLGVSTTVTPAVGVSFIAITATPTTGTGVVEAPAASGSGISDIDVIGDPNQMCNVSSGGAIILLRCLAATSSSVTTPIATAPADGSVVGLRFVMTSLAGT